MWAAYALADLEPEQAEHCEWHLAAGGDPGVLLIYRGFETPVLFALGSPERVQPLVAEIGNEKRLYVAVRPEIGLPLRRAGYEIHGEKRMLRMVLDPGAFRPERDPSCSRLKLRDRHALAELYADGEQTGEAPAFFQESMLAFGVYYGIREGDALVAAAGTHVLAHSTSVAAIGNVYTRRDRRGLGLARRVTAAVAAELLEQSMRTIVLNVEAGNAAAVAVYGRLGFERYCDFLEGAAMLGPSGATSASSATPRAPSRGGPER